MGCIYSLIDSSVSVITTPRKYNQTPTQMRWKSLKSRSRIATTTSYRTVVMCVSVRLRAIFFTAWPLATHRYVALSCSAIFWCTSIRKGIVIFTIIIIGDTIFVGSWWTRRNAGLCGLGNLSRNALKIKMTQKEKKSKIPFSNRFLINNRFLLTF